MRLTSTGPYGGWSTEKPELARLKTHFLMTLREIDDVDSVEPKLYRKTSNLAVICFWTVVLALLLYLLYKFVGMVM